jgi:hypothetical protein
MVDVLVDRLLEVPWPQEQQPLQAPAADRAHPPLGEGVGPGRADGRSHHAGALRGEGGIERRRDFRVAVAEQDGMPDARFGQVPRDVARLLGL